MVLMPNYPIHNFGMDRIAQGGFIGLSQKWDREKAQQDMMRQILLTGAKEGALGDTPTATTTTLFGEAAPMLHGISKQAADQKKLDHAQKKLDTQLNFMGKIDDFVKSIDTMEEHGLPTEGLINWLNNSGKEFGFEFNLTKHMDSKERKEAQQKAYLTMIGSEMDTLTAWAKGDLKDLPQGAGPMLYSHLKTTIAKYEKKYKIETGMGDMIDKIMEQVVEPPDEGKKTGGYTGDVGQFYQVHGRPPATPQELQIFKEQTRLSQQEDAVTWTTATKELRTRIAKTDVMGNVFWTPDTKGKHKIAQNKLAELKEAGNVQPLEAINQAEAFADNVERRYWEYVEAAERDEDKKSRKDKVSKVKKAFAEKYGYLPRVKDVAPGL